MTETLKQLLDLLKTDSPYVIYPFLIVFVIGWLLPKSKEVEGWKELFSKNRTEEMRKAKELLEENKEEAAFYDEAMRQEIFHNLIGIRCRKEYREMIQRIVNNGIASTESIRLAYRFIDIDDSKTEVRFGWLDWIWRIYLEVQFIFGAIFMPRFLFALLLNFNLSTLPSQLLGLSLSTLFIFGALKGLLPMVAARGIKKILKKLEEKNEERAASPPEQIDAAGEQNAPSG